MIEEKASYLMLFCALLLVRNGQASLEQSLTLAPLSGAAKQLAGHLARGHLPAPFPV